MSRGYQEHLARVQRYDSQVDQVLDRVINYTYRNWCTIQDAAVALGLRVTSGRPSPQQPGIAIVFGNDPRGDVIWLLPDEDPSPDDESAPGDPGTTAQ